MHQIRLVGIALEEFHEHLRRFSMGLRRRQVDFSQIAIRFRGSGGDPCEFQICIYGRAGVANALIKASDLSVGLIIVRVCLDYSSAISNGLIIKTMKLWTLIQKLYDKIFKFKGLPLLLRLILINNSISLFVYPAQNV